LASTGFGCLATLLYIQGVSNPNYFLPVAYSDKK